MKYPIKVSLFNEESDERVEEYVTQFNQFGKKSAEGVIGMGRVTLEAKQKLQGDNEFKKFCNRIRFENDSSALRKLMQIGKKADLLEKHLDQLPSSWTTLYWLSTLTDAQLEDGLSQKRIDPTMTAAKIKNAVTEISGKRSTTTLQKKQQAVQQIADNSLTLTLRFDSPPTTTAVKEIEAAVDEIANKQNVYVRAIRSPALVALIADEAIVGG
jgi:hypothetical protein